MASTEETLKDESKDRQVMDPDSHRARLVFSRFVLGACPEYTWSLPAPRGLISKRIPVSAGYIDQEKNGEKKSMFTENEVEG